MGWALDNLGRAECQRIAEAAIAAAGGRVSQRSEERLSAHCPFPDHRDSNPSFGYNAEIDAYVCSCGRQGDLIDLWAELQGIGEKREGFRAFKKRFGPEADGGAGSSNSKNAARPPGSSPGPSAEDQGGGPKIIPESAWAQLEPLPEPWLKRLEESRGWSRETMRALDLRLAVDSRGQERVAIPVRARGGELLNVRLYRPGGGAGKVYSWGKGYGLARLWPHPARWRGKDTVWLCEGEPDCILALSLGLDAVTSTAGARAFKPHWADWFAGKEVAIVYDHDRPGREGALKAARELAGTARRVRLVRWPDFMAEHQDLTDWFLTHGRAIGELRDCLEDFEPEDDPEASGPPATAGDDDKPDDWPLLRFKKNSAFDGKKAYRPLILAQEIKAENRIVVDRASRVIYRWGGQVWEPAAVEDLERLVIAKLGKVVGRAKITEAVHLLLSLSMLPPDREMNLRQDLVCLPNGMLSLDTLDVLPHDPEHLATYMTPWEFDPDAPRDCPRFKQFLREVLEDPRVITELQEFMGYVLWPHTVYERALFLIGQRGSGKSTLLDVIQWLVGEDNCSNVNLPNLEDQFQLASLYGKALNVYDEADTRYFTTQHFNTLVSGKPILAAFKHKDPFTFRFRGKLVFAANGFPRAAGDLDAFMDRLTVIHFSRTFRGTAQQDPHLGDKLREEMPGIFAWALVGLCRLRARGRFVRSEAGRRVVEDYRFNISPVLQFIDERITTEPQGLEPTAQVSNKDLYAAWEAFCKASGYKNSGMAQFMKELKSLGPPFLVVRRGPKGGPRPRCVEGITLLPLAGVL